MQNYTCLQSSCVHTALFFTEPVSKKCGNYTFYVWKAFWCPKRGCGIGVVQQFGGFSQQIKVCQQIGIKDYASRLPKDEESREFSVNSFQKFRIKIKKYETYSGFHPILGLSSDITLRWI
jgi:hypothetical protein